MKIVLLLLLLYLVGLVCSILLSVYCFAVGEFCGGMGWLTAGILFVGSIVELVRDDG